MLRKYLEIEADQKAAEMQLVMLNTMATPTFTEQGKAQAWTDTVRKSWTNFLSNLYYVEVTEETQKDVEMLNYYEKFVKKIKPVIKKNSNGKGLIVEGFDSLKKLIARDNTQARLKEESKNSG